MKNIKGYRIFYRYLNYIWNSEEHDYLGALLGGMSFLPDGVTADPARESDWDDAIEKASDSNDPYQIGIQFLNNCLDIGYIDEIGQILSDMKEHRRLDLWQKAVEDVQMNADNPNLEIKWD